MMPVSPWFYTNLPAYSKNWLWHSDSIWHYRWLQAISLAPTFIQIISWNDYGESHYIGPIRPSGVVSGAWYVDSNHAHTGWTAFLPHYIAAYKAGSTASLSNPPTTVAPQATTQPINHMWHPAYCPLTQSSSPCS